VLERRLQEQQEQLQQRENELQVLQHELELAAERARVIHSNEEGPSEELKNEVSGLRRKWEEGLQSKRELQEGIQRERLKWEAEREKHEEALQGMLRAMQLQAKEFDEESRQHKPLGAMQDAAQRSGGTDEVGHAAQATPTFQPAVQVTNLSARKG